MPIEKQLREELLQAGKEMPIPLEVEKRVHRTYQHFLQQKKGRQPLMKKRLLASIVAVAILIPTAALATPYLADEIFGSSKAIMERGGTQQSYNEIEAFLQEAKGKLTDEEFTEYVALTKQLMQLKLKITDENGVPHEDKLTAEEQELYQQLASKLSPLFEKIKGSAK